jgi:hypothetical protein
MTDQKTSQKGLKTRPVKVDDHPGYEVLDDSGKVIETIIKSPLGGQHYYKRHGDEPWMTEDEAREEGITLSTLPQKNK